MNALHFEKGWDLFYPAELCLSLITPQCVNMSHISASDWQSAMSFSERLSRLMSMQVFLSMNLSPS